MLAESWLQSLVTAVAVIASSLPGTTSAPEMPAQVASSGDWVASWGAAMTEAGPAGPAAKGVRNQTIRQVAHLSVGGSTLRIRLSNRFGKRPLVVGRATVAPRKSSAAGTPNVELLRLIPVTFRGSAAVTIPVGREAVSDPIDVEAPDDSDLVISTYFPGSTGPLTQHPAGYATAFAAPGNQTGAGGAAYRRIPGMARFVVDGVDVRSDARGSVVLFGDSITDGASSPINGNLRYPDQLADLLALRRYGAVNAGIGGNRLLANGGVSGEAAIARFERDVIRRPGVKSVLVLEGINDIRATRGGISATQLINAHKVMIAKAHAAGLKAYGATLTPYWATEHYTVGGEIARQALNQWIRTSGEYDGYVDFEHAVRDPKQPLRLLPAYDSGDHLHPNAKGFTAMARAVDLLMLTS
ncbi:lysophospholipase L1-like esterase [Kribbella amoyensis]|uniref:Lysophospholipase L1-like esterase n=1 Tax=Kribbella amoyensis TaxID=996641 RepID=A0A561BN52_9ACTN|nr:SGNH/GDSL hydrolase family protein [Kribbella amoyensis]TWD80268.1 lysophospholipase L1-like esterase [Kribbella amoyensis]